MSEMKVFSIGKIVNREEMVCIELNPKYPDGLKGLTGYSHIQVLWWADGCDNDRDRNSLTEKKPYKNGPEEMGIFAMRSPERINPIAVSNAEIAYIDTAKGIVGLYYIDAFDGTQILDLKPYVPSIDRIENPRTPEWCSHWPKSYEESGDFDWEAEFNF
ncbi:MAG: SAM-dependent methyltransferase [Proteobacteria bacterium]|nr:SAM-dependent methyltransferase [Pseudomonadota bacterium]